MRGSEFPNPTMTREIIAAFLKERVESEGAAPEDESSWCLEWHFQSGAKLWLDIEDDGTFRLLWKRCYGDEPITYTLGVART